MGNEYVYCLDYGILICQNLANFIRAVHCMLIIPYLCVVHCLKQKTQAPNGVTHAKSP